MLDGLDRFVKITRPNGITGMGPFCAPAIDTSASKEASWK